MRVISGIYKSRKLDGYNVLGIRPTMDKVKESVFAIINPYIKDSIFLDLFGGTGSIAIEAISNGAKECYIVDNSSTSINVINSNIKKLDIKNCTILKSDYKVAIDKFISEKKKFDIIFIDPPYGKINIKDVLNRINDILNINGIVICEYECEELDNVYGNLHLFKNKTYGNTKIAIYKWGE